MEDAALQNEKRHLAEILAVVRRQMDKAAKESDKHAKALHAMQEERMESSRADTDEMYGIQGFSELLALSQGAQALTQAAAARDSAEQTIRSLLKMQDTPYFARIDFRPDAGQERTVYIGRATLMENDTMQIYVYDWRVPIASLFYQYGVGPAQYDAPAGTIRGEMLLKRQYEIERGELRYYFDANEQVLDAFLRELLSKPAAPAMKSIVETIQRDQDRIIRDMQADVLMVQGSAGSGKTSVALHRVAYLMYEGLKKGRLSPSDILILAPNAAFERYISRVLPDLGERQVRTLLSEELLSDMLPGARIEPKSAWIEKLLTEADAERKHRMRRFRSIKGSRAFLRLLDRLIEEIPRKWLPFSEVAYGGRCVATAESSRVFVCNCVKKVPLGVKLRMLERSIWARIHALRPARYAKLLEFAGQFPHHATEAEAFARMLSIRESGRLLAQIRSFTRIDCALLYRALFLDKDAFSRVAEGLVPPEDTEPLRLATLACFKGAALPYEDAAAIAYLKARVNGTRAYAHLKQVVVDEAQDLDALHAALLGLLFPNARFTILGDVHQTLSGPADLSLYEEIQKTLGRPNSLLVKLDKSFRCTREIWAFCARFLPPGAAGECFSRSGEAPGVYGAKNESEMDALLLSNARQCLRGGHRSVALLCKTERDADALYGRLKGEKDVARVGAEDGIRNNRISVLSLYMAKGLEFDAVLLCGVDKAQYCGKEDRNLLYIGCSRALHVLRLFYVGEESPLLRAETGVGR